MKKMLILIFAVLIGLVFIVSGCEQYVGRNVNIANVDQQKINNVNNEIAKNNQITNNIQSEESENYKNTLQKNNYLYFPISQNENEYIIRTFVDDKKEMYYNNELVENIPQRDQPRREDRGIEPDIEEYFDVNINLNEENEWVENQEITVFVYYEGLNFFDAYVANYAFEENHRVYLSDNIERNDFDVIIVIGTHEKRIIMVKPILENEREVIFDLSNIQRIETNVWELCEEREAKVVVDSLNLRRDSERGFFYSSYETIIDGGRIEQEIDSYIYIAEDTFNPNWQLLKINYCIERDMGWSATGNHFGLTIGNIHYPVEEIYRIENNDLRKITFNIQDSFVKNNYMNQFYFFFGYGFMFYYPIDIVPFRINFLFNENNFLKRAHFLYSRAQAYGGDIKRIIPFERYYNEYDGEEVILDIIKRPNALKLYNELSDDFPYPYLRGYLSDDTNFNNNDGYPSDFIYTNRLERGYLRITTPQENVYSSLRQGDGFLISCNEEGRVDLLDGMECIEGDYIIRWAFTNIIKNRDLYLDAVVHYDGEEWTIVRQNSRAVDRPGGTPAKRLER